MSLRLRLVCAFGYVLVFAIIALEVPLTLNFSRRVDSEIKAEASAGAHGVATAASGRLDDPRALAALARDQGRRLGGRVLVVDPRGRVLVDSDGAAARGASYASRPEIGRALRGVAAQGTRHSDSLNADLLYTAVPVVDGGRATGAVRLTQSVKAVHEEVRRDVLALLALGAAVLALGLGLAWAIAGSLSRPLRGLAGTARRIAAGDLQARATPAGSTEQVEVANAFNDMTERLVRALDAQRDFVANASHQLRTPLTGLRLRLESASLRADDPDLRRDLVAGELEAERLAKLLSNLLRLAQEGQPPATATSIALADVAERAAERWRDQAEREGHAIEVAGEGTPHVHASAGDLDTMVDNLVENALHYSAPDTPIRIEWGVSAQEAFIAVLDHGGGIDDDEAERIFDRFYRGRASRGGAPGTGLGLAIVEALARRWGARAALTNRPEGGARAELRFPAVTAPAPTPTVAR
ncbi:MAG TPA: ATP-binding protein [Solirubrobacteraceae bacterium]|jgi:signal transduction histidine kinase